MVFSRASGSGSTSAARSASKYSRALGTCTSPCVKRWPYEEPPNPSTVRSSSFAQSQRTGRAKRRPESSQRIDFENASPRTISFSRSGSASRSGRPGTSTPRKPSRTSRSPTSTPCFFAKPSAALSRRFSGGPLTHSSGSRSGRSSTRSTSRRGPTSTLPFSQLRQLGAKLRLRLSAGRGGQLLAPDLKQQAGQSSPRRAGRPCARACEPGRCTRRAPSPRWRRARPEG